MSDEIVRLPKKHGRTRKIARFNTTEPSEISVSEETQEQPATIVKKGGRPRNIPRIATVIEPVVSEIEPVEVTPQVPTLVEPVFTGVEQSEIREVSKEIHPIVNRVEPIQMTRNNEDIASKYFHKNSHCYLTFIYLNNFIVSNIKHIRSNMIVTRNIRLGDIIDLNNLPTSKLIYAFAIDHPMYTIKKYWLDKNGKIVFFVDLFNENNNDYRIYYDTSFSKRSAYSAYVEFK
jgi:hypothetical protein